jgi:hypothetical protein
MAPSEVMGIQTVYTGSELCEIWGYHSGAAAD